MEFRSMEEDKIKNLQDHTIQNTTNSPHRDPAWLAYAKIRSSGRDKTVQQWSSMAGLCKDQKFRKRQDSKTVIKHGWLMQRSEVPEETRQYNSDQAWLAYAKIRSSRRDKTVQQWSSMVGLCKDQKFQKRQDSTTVIKHGWLMQRSEVPEETRQYNSDRAWLAYAKIKSSRRDKTVQQWSSMAGVCKDKKLR